ncbi:MAG: alpha-glucosidase [Cyanobacteria bacterium P01_A01_bin.17]
MGQTVEQPLRWWQKGVIYQIYPLTFADGNGDGIGDLAGITRRLDYLNDGNPDGSSLGVSAIWLSPINQSPLEDGGYDISDYYAIDPVFGTMADFEQLLTEAHKREIRVILDLVINHTSNQHAWFTESRASRDNSKADWYIWRDPAEDGGVPNNWRSYFGDCGWTFEPQRNQYYFHVFAEAQPDLNWANPDVRAEIHQLIRFWLDKGVDGFRLDASSVYSKDQLFRDNPIKFGASDEDTYSNYHHLYDRDLPENHQIIREIRSVIDEYDDRVLIGETFIDSSLYQSVSFYGTDNDELHLPFSFEFPFSAWYPGHLQQQIQKQELDTPEGAWPIYFLDNHDIPRHLSRWIECSQCTDPKTVATGAATLLLTVRGTPVLYYGQELGMVNHESIPPGKQHDSVEDQEQDSSPRDGARTPMQWNCSAQAGFSFGKEIEPWLPVHENYTDINVEVELADQDSILNFYRQLIQLRKQSRALREGSWRALIDYPHEQLTYLRETEDEQVLVIINFGDQQPLKLDPSITASDWDILLSTRFAQGQTIHLPEKLDPFEISILQRSA